MFTTIGASDALELCPLAGRVPVETGRDSMTRLTIGCSSTASLLHGVVRPRWWRGKLLAFASLVGSNCCARCALLAWVVTFGIALGCFIRSRRRSATLIPLLSVLVKAPVCLQSGTFCELEMASEQQKQFDLHKTEEVLLAFLYVQVANRSEALLRDMLCGAYVLLSDPDELAYIFFQHLPGAYRRVSSHDSNSQQYGVDLGDKLNTALVGTRPGHMTWFQLEGAAWNLMRPVASLGHIFDAVQYLVLGRNVGPLGRSSFTERHPLVLRSHVGPAQDYCESCAGSDSTSLLSASVRHKRRRKP